MGRIRHLHLLPLIGLSAILFSCTSPLEFRDKRELKRAIAEKADYNTIKERRIKELHTLIRTGGGNLQWEYEINSVLADEFTKFNLDSAIRYSKRNVLISELLEDKERRIESSLQLAVLDARYGLFLESVRLLDRMRGDIPEKYLPEFYECYAEVYDVYKNITDYEGHHSTYQAYCDSLKNLTGKDLAQKSDIETLYSSLSPVEQWSPDYSVATHHLARYYEADGQLDSAKHYYTLSSISDIRNSNRDQGSLIRLARMYYDEGNFSDGYRFAKSSIEDAIKGNMRIRTMRMSESFQIINDAYQVKEISRKWMIIISLIVVSVAVFYAFHKNIKLEASKLQQKRMHDESQELNARLKEQNAILSSTYSMQEKYISNFFEIGAAHINKLEKYQHNLRKMVVANKIDDLLRELKSNDMIQNELRDQHIMFDNIFLDIYPTFVEEFNALLKPDQRIITKPGELLNTELRIYALMRIGFDNCEKIAGFLRCTVPTIYTYRAKTRSRAKMPREEFEAAIMGIGAVPLLRRDKTTSKKSALE